MFIISICIYIISTSAPCSYVHTSMSSLLVYSSGLFPLLAHGSTPVRSSLLDIYERYYLAVGRGLVPCLPGMVLGLLPGLEDESEHTERYMNAYSVLYVICRHTKHVVLNDVASV